MIYVCSISGCFEWYVNKLIYITALLCSCPQLLLAALNEPWSGNMRNSLVFACQRQAQNANLTGNFILFISSDLKNLQSIVNSFYSHLPCPPQTTTFENYKK